MTKILLLDSNSLVNRAFYALPPLENKKGVFTNAIFGYLSMLSRLITDVNPTHIGAVFDLKAPTFRHKKYAEYKGKRKPMPEELACQIPILKELIAEMGIKILTLEGYEADDIIGTIAKRFDYETVIVSGDRDVLQLVDGNTVVYNTKRGVTDIKEYTTETLKDEGFTPRKVIEYKALAGDTSDNIPGCPGVGEKTAIGLLNEYGDVDGIYASINDIKGKLGERLKENKDLVYLSRELATIDTCVPIECELSDIEFKKGNISDKFIAHLNELECFKLVPRFNFGGNKVPQKAESSVSIVADLGATPVKPLGEESLPFAEEKKSPERIYIKDKDQLHDILNCAHANFSISVGKDVAFAFDENTEYVVKCAETLIDDGMNFEEAICCFRDILCSPVHKVFFDVKDKLHLFKNYDITVSEPWDDVLLKSYLSNSNYTYKSEAEFMSANGYPEDGVAGIFDIDVKLNAQLKEKELLHLYNDIELPLVKILFDMENSGFSIDIAVLDSLSEKYTEEIRTLTEEIYQVAGEKFNINSVRQLGDILFEKLSLPHGKKTKTGYSVAAEILEEIDHPIISLILRYRQIKKLLSTYIEGMRDVINKNTGKVHTIFKQCLTSTGRLSSTEPNLQNIPVRTEEGREIRRMFVPSAGNILVTADYSQIELRLLAHFSGDPVLTEAYNTGKDIHAITASKIYDVPLSLVTKEMRRRAKAVNFGIIYGISAFGLARNTGISPGEAKVFVAKYFETYPSVKAYMDANVAYAKEHGYIRTLEGRIRYFPEFNSPNKNIRNFGERASMNMPLQGSASDIIKIAMIRVYNALNAGGYKAKIILQVHDELVIDCPMEEADEVKKLLVDNMESAVRLNIPLIADGKSGKNWYMVE